MVDAGALIDLTDLIDKYGPSITNVYGDYFNRIKYSSEDPAIYTIPTNLGVDHIAFDAQAGPRKNPFRHTKPGRGRTCSRTKRISRPKSGVPPTICLFRPIRTTMSFIRSRRTLCADGFLSPYLPSRISSTSIMTACCRSWIRRVYRRLKKSTPA